MKRVKQLVPVLGGTLICWFIVGGPSAVDGQDPAPKSTRTTGAGAGQDPALKTRTIGTGAGQDPSPNTTGAGQDPSPNTTGAGQDPSPNTTGAGQDPARTSTQNKGDQSKLAPPEFVRGLVGRDSKPTKGGAPVMVPTASNPMPVVGALPKTLERHNPDCGVHVLYVFLRLNNCKCDLDQIRAELPLTELGANMLDLRDGSVRHGVPAEVVQGDPNQFSGREPFIARLHTPGSRTEGHYVVVTRMTDDVVDLIDSTVGTQVEAPRATFEKEFTGYAIVRSERAASTITLNTILAVLCGLEMLALLAILGLTRKKAQNPAATSELPVASI